MPTRSGRGQQGTGWPRRDSGRGTNTRCCGTALPTSPCTGTGSGGDVLEALEQQTQLGPRTLDDSQLVKAVHGRELGGDVIKAKGLPRQEGRGRGVGEHGRENTQQHM
jgi:hypothetical protein